MLGFSAGNFFKYQSYNLCALCKLIAIITMLKITFFLFLLKSIKLDLPAAFVLFTVTFSYTAFFYVFTFKMLKILFMSEVQQYRCILSFFVYFTQNLIVCVEVLRPSHFTQNNILNAH